MRRSRQGVRPTDDPGKELGSVRGDDSAKSAEKKDRPKEKAVVIVTDPVRHDELEEIEELLDLLADKEQAEAVLKMLVANSAPNVIQNSEDIRRLRLESGLGVAFDADYPWDQFKDMEDDPVNMFGFEATVGTITSIGAIGYVFWTLRGGVLVAAALSTHCQSLKTIQPRTAKKMRTVWVTSLPRKPTSPER